MEKEREYYPIYSLSMATYLIREGHQVFKIVDNLKQEGLKVFLFIDSPRLRESMSRLK